MNLLIKNKYQWSIGGDGQCRTLNHHYQLSEKLTKLRCEVGHLEFVEINNYAVESKLSLTCSRKLVG
jgi:hypothetical protein